MTIRARVVAISLAAAACLSACGLPGTAAADQGSALDLALSARTSGDPDSVMLTYTVTNRGTTACLLPTVADGSLHLTAVTRDEMAIPASPGVASYIGGWDAAIADSLTSVSPGATVTATVEAFRPASMPETLRLETVDGLPGGTAMTTTWDVAPHGHYTGAAVFAVPAVRTGTCTGVSRVATTEFVVGSGGMAPGLPTTVLVGLGIAVAVALGVVLMWRRRRARRAGTLVAALLAACVVVGNGQQLATAEIVAPSEAGLYESVGRCLAQYRRPGFDPGGLVDPAVRPGSPPIEIVRIKAGAHGSGTRTDPIDLNDPAKGSRIQWDPDSAFVLDGVPHTACSALYHELQHAMDFRSDVDGRTGECSGVPVSDVHALAAENGFRAKAGLPQRTRYHGTPIPPITYEQCLDKLKKEKAAKGENTAGGAGSGIGAGGGSSGESWLFGDPHLATPDGQLYDFQAAGEFVAVNGEGLEVQVRLQPLPASTTVSAVTAVAVRSGASRASWTMRDGTLTALVDGELLAVGPDRTAAFGPGGSITARDSALAWGGLPGYTVRWSDGTRLFVDATAYWGVRVGFTPAASRHGAISGLLGNADGTPDNDLVPRAGGTPLPANPSYEQLYRTFGDSWRIGADSAFDYLPGESTATFTDRTFPERMLSVSDLTPEQRRRAELACAVAGVDFGALLDACMLDVAQTGQPTFAFTAALTGAEDGVLAAAGSEHPQAPAQPGDNLRPGATITGSIPEAGSAVYPFSATGGDVAFFRGGDCPVPSSGTPSWTVRELTGELADYHGVVDTCHDLGRVAFARDGTYQIEVSGPGTFQFTWIPARPDRRLPLTIGQEITGRIDNPGEADLFPFTVRAGQSLTFRPSEGCADAGLQWFVITADGSSEGRGIDNACHGIGPIHFDHDGAYLLRISSTTRAAVGDYAFTAVPG